MPLDLHCQSAFRKNFSVLEHPLTLECLVKNLRDRKILCVLVDLCKAFPSVCRYLLLTKLQDLGLSDVMVKCLSCLFVDDKFSVLYGGEPKGEVLVNKGLKEGSCLSPILFLMYISDLPNYLSNAQEIDSPLIGGFETPCLQFADDVILLSESQSGMSKLIAKFEEYCMVNGLTINPSKTEVLSFPKFSSRFLFLVSGHVKSVSKCATYLGVVFASGMNSKLNLESRLSKAKVAFASLVSANNRLNFSSLKFMCDLYRSLVLSCLSYSVFLNVTHPYFKKLESFHTTCLRKIARLPCSTSNACVLRLTNFPCLKCHVLSSFSKILLQLCVREEPSLALSAVRDLWEEENLIGFHGDASWRARTILQEFTTWSDKFCSYNDQNTWEGFIRRVRDVVNCCDKNGVLGVCQNFCCFHRPLTKK